MGCHRIKMTCSEINILPLTCCSNILDFFRIDIGFFQQPTVIFFCQLVWIALANPAGVLGKPFDGPLFNAKKDVFYGIGADA